MVDRRRFLVGAGSLLVGSGAIYQSGAFSKVAADRGMNLQTAADPNALLGLEGVSDAGTTPTFTNNTDGPMDVTLDSTDTSVEFDLGDMGSFTNGRVSFSLSPGETRTVAINGGSTSVPVSVNGELLAGDGNVDGQISLTRSYAVPQAGQVQLTPNVTSTGNSGKYEFELENTGSIDVSIVGIGVNETSEPNAIEVAGGGILVVEGTSVLSQTIPVDSTAPDQDTRVDFNNSVSLDTGVTKLFEFEKFRTAGSGNSGAKMKGESVTATFYFSDGSSKTVTMSE